MAALRKKLSILFGEFSSEISYPKETFEQKNKSLSQQSFYIPQASLA